ncbi:PilX N-terminal domain-containing pilus assembly protein [Thermodesulfobacteriota bacterium]
MKAVEPIVRDEKGSVIIIALIVLVLLTIIGTSATDITSVELQISANDKFHKVAFYSAEAGRGYVAAKPDIYGPENITTGVSHYFPNDTDPYVANTTDPSVSYTLGVSQTFTGTVGYTGFSNPPRGSGYEAGKFRAHKYTLASGGTGPRNSASDIEAGFYRIGF